MATTGKCPAVEGWRISKSSTLNSSSFKSKDASASDSAFARGQKLDIYLNSSPTFPNCR